MRLILAFLAALLAAPSLAVAQASLSPRSKADLMTVTPSFGTKARTLAERSADSLNFLDVSGSDPTGVAQQSATFTTAFGLAGANGRGLLVPYGSFKMTTGSPTLPVNVPLVFGPGVKFTTNGNYIAGTSDFTPFIDAQITGAWMRSTNKTGNEWGTFTNLDIQTTGSTANYIKGAAYFIATTSDRSPTTLLGDATSVNKDAVGILAASGISAGNTRGRAFAGNFYASAPAGSDGNLVGVEIDVGNYTGNAQATIDQANSKTGLSVVAIGSTPNTNAMVITSGNGGLWSHGLDILAASLASGGDAWRLLASGSTTTTLAKLDALGNLTATSVTAQGTNGVKLQGVGSGAAAVSSTAGALSVTASGSNPTYLGSGTSGTIVQSTLTLANTNSIVAQGVASGAASIATTAGPLLITASGSNQTYLGSGTSPVVVQNALFTSGSASIGGAVGFNGNAAVGKCTLPAAATDAATTQALVNAIRSCLVTNGLAQ